MGDLTLRVNDKDKQDVVLLSVTLAAPMLSLDNRPFGERNLGCIFAGRGGLLGEMKLNLSTQEKWEALLD